MESMDAHEASMLFFFSDPDYKIRKSVLYRLSKSNYNNVKYKGEVSLR